MVVLREHHDMTAEHRTAISFLLFLTSSLIATEMGYWVSAPAGVFGFVCHDLSRIAGVAEGDIWLAFFFPRCPLICRASHLGQQRPNCTVIRNVCVFLGFIATDMDAEWQNHSRVLQILTKILLYAWVLYTLTFVDYR